jgi:hypothetical protein
MIIAQLRISGLANGVRNLTQMFRGIDPDLINYWEYQHLFRKNFEEFVFIVMNHRINYQSISALQRFCCDCKTACGNARNILPVKPVKTK